MTFRLLLVFMIFLAYASSSAQWSRPIRPIRPVRPTPPSQVPRLTPEDNWTGEGPAWHLDHLEEDEFVAGWEPDYVPPTPIKTTSTGLSCRQGGQCFGTGAHADHF